MKKYYLVLLLLVSIDALACDICGCVNGGSFFGVLPQGHRQFAGLRYRQNSFNSHIGSTLLAATETFQTTEAWTRLYPIKNIQLMAFVPFQENSQTRKYDQFQAVNKGIGDIRMLVHYNLLNTFTDTTRNHQSLNHQMLFGLGIKAPTGHYQFDRYDVSEVANANFQLGTGSWDFPLNIIYTLKKHDWGINANLTYNVNSSNNNGYQFANQTLLSALVFNTIDIKNSSLVLSGGLNSEFKRQDKLEGERNEFTGGWYMNGTLGIDFYTAKYAFGINGQIPLIQNLSNQELKLQNGFGISISRMF